MKTVESIDERIRRVEIVNKEMDQFYQEKEQRMDENKKRIETLIIQAVLQDDLVTTQKKMLKLQQSQVPQGKNIYLSFTVYAGDSIIHLNFVEGQKKIVDPRGRHYNVPHTPLFSLTVVNDGPGDIKISAGNENAEASSYATESVIPSKERLNMNYNYPVIRYINLINQSGTDAVVRLYGLI